MLQFKQSWSSWLKQYIDLNNKKRTNAENSFEKDFFKLMNNRVFGRNDGDYKDWSLFSGKRGRAVIFGGRVTTILAWLWGGPFKKKCLVGEVTVFLMTL